MGMAQQVSKYNNEFSNAAEPLRELLSIKNAWLWTDEHETSFQNVKTILTSPAVLKLYDVHKPTKLRVDGSKLNGISVILYQQHNNKWHPVTCASRFLTPTERNYHPIEIEMLAVTWGCKKMHMYLHGLPRFLVETDHKPLIPILNNKMLIDMSPRIQRMRMTLLKYSFTAEHVKGSNMEDADALSRAPTQKPNQDDEIAEQETTTHVNTVIENMPATNTKLDQIRELSKNDSTLQELKTLINQGWPNQRQQCPIS
jgi:hypothetical protein